MLEHGFITPLELRESLEKQSENGSGQKIGELLIQLKYANSDQVSQALARQYGHPWINLNKVDIEPDVLEMVPKNVAVEHNIVPVAYSSRYLRIAMADPLDFFTTDNLRFILNTDVECILASKDAVRDAISNHYGEITALDEMIGDLTADDVDVRDDLDGDLTSDDGDDAPVIKLVNLIISEAIRKRASDIHIEPFEKRIRVRYRVDGRCIEQDAPPKRLQGPILSRIKIMAKMDMAERRKPQDGRIKMVVQKRDIDFRVSALPARHGESLVLRVLDKEKALVDLETLGFHHTDFVTCPTRSRRPAEPTGSPTEPIPGGAP